MESSCFIEYKIDPRIEIITVFFSNPKLKHVHPIKSYKNNFSQFKLKEINDPRIITVFFISNSMLKTKIPSFS